MFRRTPAPPNPASQAQEPKSPEVPLKRANQAEEKERAKKLETQCKEMNCCGTEAMGKMLFSGGIHNGGYKTGKLHDIIYEPRADLWYNSKAQYLDEIEGKLEVCKKNKEQLETDVSIERTREKIKINELLESCCLPSTRFRLEALNQLATNPYSIYKSNMHELNLIEEDIKQTCPKTGGRKSKKPKRKKITRQRR